MKDKKSKIIFDYSFLFNKKKRERKKFFRCKKCHCIFLAVPLSCNYIIMGHDIFQKYTSTCPKCFGTIVRYSEW